MPVQVPTQTPLNLLSARFLAQIGVAHVSPLSAAIFSLFDFTCIQFQELGFCFLELRMEFRLLMLMLMVLESLKVCQMQN